MVKRQFTVMSASLSRPTIRHLSQIRINATSRHRSGGPDADPLVPVSFGHLARRLLAGPVEVTGNGRSQIRCDGGSPCPAPSFCWCSAICAHQSALRWRRQFRLCCGSESPPSTTRTPQSIARPRCGHAAIRNNLTHRSKHNTML